MPNPSHLQTSASLKKNKILILLICLTAFLFRLYSIRDNSLYFYYDQARDACNARSIIENHDLKIQGPTVSGTNNSLYHGVLYYYLIAIPYTLSGGNPLITSIFLALLNSLTVIPIFLITYKISGNFFASILAATFFSFSREATQIGTFLFNVSLSSLTIPCFYYFFMLSFIEKKAKYLPWTALWLGLSNQSTLSTVYLAILPISAMIFKFVKNKKYLKKNVKLIISGFTIYLISISTLILTQIKSFQAGIFSFTNISTQIYRLSSLTSVFKIIIKVIFEKISFSILPQHSLISVLLFLIALAGILLHKLQKKYLYLLLFWILAPLLVVILSRRDTYHLTVGVESGAYIILSLGIFNLLTNKIKSVTIITLLLVFFIFNLLSIQEKKEIMETAFDSQKGAYLNQQLKLLDYTYAQSRGKPFSISTLAAPHGYNTTWSYLYNWYGKTKYGYAPTWFGDNQKGIPCGDLLSRETNPQNLHFTIYEPDPGSTHTVRAEFIQLQDIYAKNITNTQNFGTLQVEERLVK